MLPGTGIVVCVGVEVVPFGSFESNFYTACGDLDLSLEFPVDQDVSPTFTKSKKVKVLKSVERALGRSGIVSYVIFVKHRKSVVKGAVSDMISFGMFPIIL